MFMKRHSSTKVYVFRLKLFKKCKIHILQYLSNIRGVIILQQKTSVI